LNFNLIFVLQILQTDLDCSSSMAFGLTSCNPDSICVDSLPDDSDLLLNRPEYWVVKKEAANNPVAGDELAFTITLSGKVSQSVLFSYALSIHGPSVAVEKTSGKGNDVSMLMLQ